MTSFPFVFVYAVLLALPACSQVKNSVVKSDAYYRIPRPGTIQVDESGEPVKSRRDSVFYLYVETVAGNIEWQRAWKGQRSFSLIATKLAANAQAPAGLKQDEQPANRASKPGSTLWQIELSDDQQRTPAPQPVQGPEILLSGKKDGRLFYVRTKTLSELPSPIFP